MKIIKNNYSAEENKDQIKTIQITCDHCGSELEITEEDIYIGAYGAVYVICPCCGEEIMIEELEGVTLTMNNIEFPIHFVRSNKDIRNVKEVPFNEIVK